MEQDLTGIAGWAVSVMESLGGFGAFLLIALENLFPPLPSEIILPLAGFTASLGSLTLIEMIIWCTAGSVVGACALYAVGAALGRERTRKIMGALPLVNVNDIVKTEAWFDKHGKWTVLLGRMIPIFRSLISIPAGVTRMPLVIFTVLTLTGSLIWNTVLIYAGYILGENWSRVEGWVGIFSRIVLIAIVVFLVWWIARRTLRNIKLKKEGADPNAVDAEVANHTDTTDQSESVDAAGSTTVSSDHDFGGDDPETEDRP
ncbi:MAG: DedA family protein [Flaviflexus sp.]|uniref:DedA family protein n=1 Tax=Flaviflexus sp. TaxID=1969482 RepID=UPI00352F8072